MAKNNKERLSNAEKNAGDKKWYKEKANSLRSSHNDLGISYGGVSELKRMNVNYNLFNNILDLKDFEYVCKPFGAEAGELPANMQNHDISSGKIKALLGMEMKRPFSWRVVATNPEATTRKEQEMAKQVRDYVISQITSPIRKELEMKAAEEKKKGKLSEKELTELNQSLEMELQKRTPEEAKKYMEREHQDPVEVMTHQLLEYLIQKTEIKRKFNVAFKHLSLSAKEIMYIGILNGEPEAWNINSKRIKAKMSAMSPFVEDAEEISVEYVMTASEIVKYFGDELTDTQLDKVYTHHNYKGEDDFFTMAEVYEDSDYDNIRENKLTVTHTMWKSLRKLSFLNYKDLNGKKQLKIVSEEYQLNKEAGDISIDNIWIPEAYETWVLAPGVYAKMQPIPGQFKDIDDLYNCKFPYYGVIVDNMNSVPTAPMDRLKISQYYFNIIMYRLELLMASDKGKKVMMNINAIPDSMGIDMKKWQYFMESSPFIWFNPDEEGTGYQDVNMMAKTIDLSLASDIGKYIELADYFRRQAGIAIGVTEAVEGQASHMDSVGNNRQNLIQTSNILEPYFDLHNTFKKNVLTALLNTAKIAYAGKNSVKLSYVLDDMSIRILELDINLIDNSRVGLFISNSTKAEEAMQTIKQLAHAAMQNQKAELSDILSVIRQDGIIEAEETLKVAEKDRKAEQAEQQRQAGIQQQELEKLKQQGEEREHEREKEIIVLKEEERRKTVIAQAALTGMSFNPDTDTDVDGENDFLEIAKHGLDADIKRSKNQLDREKFDHQKKIDNKKIKLEEKKLKQSNKKAITH